MEARLDSGLARTTCPYCGVGCGLLAKALPNGTAEVRGDPDHPANFGRLCSKGSALGETVGLEGRLLHPEIDERRASWGKALDLVAKTFTETIAAHGPDSVAFYVSGQLLTEDYYVANKLMKGFIGSANIDTNSRLCMASAVAGHRRAFGSDTVPGTYVDLEQADLVVLVGSNLAWCHPVLFQRLTAAKEARPSMKIVLIDPRRTMTAEIADLHLPIRADGDVALFCGLLAFLAEEDRVDEGYVREHTSGLESALDAARGLSLEQIAETTGLPEETLLAFYRLFAATEKTVSVFSQGVNQSAEGTDKVNAIINCHLATGRIGRPGMGPFSVTGQPNAMGGREVGALANLLASHMEIDNQEHRERVQRFWNSPKIAKKPGLKAVDLFRAVAEGRIKALWIMATNPADSMPDALLVDRALKTCPFVVVSDVVLATDTVRHARVKLPAAAWGEKDGTVTNSERRISRQRAFLPLPGDAKPDWWIISEVAKRMGLARAFSYGSAADIFAEHAALSAFENEGSRAFDIGAYAMLDKRGYDELQPFQWPQPKAGGASRARFFSSGGFYTEDGKARILPLRPKQPTSADPNRPFILNTGRIRDHWHTMTRTGRSPRLSQHLAEPFAEINPEDARRLGVKDADLVRISSDSGSILVRALLSAGQRPGTVFVPMHWNDQFAASGRVDTLVPAVTDPHSGQPALKNVPAKIERFDASACGFAVFRERPAKIDCDYWAIGVCQGGFRLEFALAHAPKDWRSFVLGLLAVSPDASLLAYHDRASGHHRFALFEDDQLVVALFLATEPVEVSRVWACEQLVAQHSSQRARLAVLAGRPRSRSDDRGSIICSCFGVGTNEIAAAIAGGCLSADEVGKELKAGTNCGSCRSDIKRLIAKHRSESRGPLDQTHPRRHAETTLACVALLVSLSVLSNTANDAAEQCRVIRQEDARIAQTDLTECIPQQNQAAKGAETQRAHFGTVLVNDARSARADETRGRRSKEEGAKHEPEFDSGDKSVERHVAARDPERIGHGCASLGGEDRLSWRRTYCVGGWA
jgi:assimilatory nitrate reductase catalytic subunit